MTKQNVWLPIEGNIGRTEHTGNFVYLSFTPSTGKVWLRKLNPYGMEW